MQLLACLFFTFCFLATQSSAVTVQRVQLDISNVQLSPDGHRPRRQAVVANGTHPGPLISGNKGDNFQINVRDILGDYEGLDNQTSIHWHGIRQYRTNPYDGVAFVTQCPIVPGNSFLYNFTVGDQAGTFWYHSHFSNQYCDGLRGPMVIYDPEDPYADLYDVDDENTIITLADWYHYLSKDAPNIPKPSTTLINGVGRQLEDSSLNLAVRLSGQYRYRFRLVSISCDAAFNFTIDGHQFTIIEADGNNVEPVLVDSIPIYAAQRYSFVLNASQNVDNYWIKADPDIGVTNGTFANGVNSAILRYSGAPIQDPVTEGAISLRQLNETNLHPIDNPQAPGGPGLGNVDRQYDLSVLFNGNVNTGVPANFTVNGTSWVAPTVPVLLQILNGTKRAQDLLPHGSIYPVNANETIEIILPGVGGAGTNHPVHLHGHSFSVVKSANHSEYNYDNPVRRDVVNIGSNASDITVIRFQADNTGPWFIHCHIDWHLTAGFAAVMAEDVPDVPADDPTSDAWQNLCPIWNNTFGNAGAPALKSIAPFTELAGTPTVTLLPSSVSVYSGTPFFTVTATSSATVIPITSASYSS
ncbi:laccase protein [Stereum hirsutum FP-91666 SS1]|uniref:laccase protein n=1 Tax=Stereum hirsutum (strain FP-91666) TaxID=721885 RepID=UPI000440D706|nr:laccase protein [Stereum hirsutum FP-91666 SS1]EIM88745.1 laccase protein [Stereum hirsutum FP-91666 SS1]